MRYASLFDAGGFVGLDAALSLASAAAWDDLPPSSTYASFSSSSSSSAAGAMSGDEALCAALSVQPPHKLFDYYNAAPAARVSHPPTCAPDQVKTRKLACSDDSTVLFYFIRVAIARGVKSLFHDLYFYFFKYEGQMGE
jgi:hypothetical protein